MYLGPGLLLSRGQAAVDDPGRRWLVVSHIRATSRLVTVTSTRPAPSRAASAVVVVWLQLGLDSDVDPHWPL